MPRSLHLAFLQPPTADPGDEQFVPQHVVQVGSGSFTLSDFDKLPEVHKIAKESHLQRGG